MAYAIRMPTETQWTADRVYALPDDGLRREVLDGELAVTPAPSLAHQGVAGALFALLREYCKRHGFGEALFSPADIEFSPRRLVQPDVFVVPRVDGKLPRQWSEVKRLLLAVEVLSPTTARHDRGKKRHIYQAEGVGEYWIVDLDARCVERWRPEDTRPEVVHEVLEWRPEGGEEALVVDLGRLFGEQD